MGLTHVPKRLKKMYKIIVIYCNFINNFCASLFPPQLHVQKVRNWYFISIPGPLNIFQETRDGVRSILGPFLLAIMLVSISSALLRFFDFADF